MAFLYPWGNTQQLNLDWILQKIKELEAGNVGSVLDEVANALISATYARQAYDRSDIVFYDGKLYRANQAIPAPGEAWTPAHWDEILLGDTVSNLVQYVAALSNDQITNSSSVIGTHTSDALDNLNTATSNKILYFTSQAVAAATGNILDISNAKITAEYVLLECTFATPSNITTKLTWTTSAGHFILNGTCTAATTANVTLGKKDN